jgi:hypothetical protein
MTFADGIIVKTHTFANGGEIIKLSFKLPEFLAFAEKHKNGDWLNININTSQKSGKKYAALDEYKKGEKQDTKKIEAQTKIEEIPSDLPF